LVAVCYESQLFDDLVVAPHDVFMDKVVTERTVYQGSGQRNASASSISDLDA
jgi:5-formyltetrahydrofolate cyclo-ligase